MVTGASGNLSGATCAARPGRRQLRHQAPRPGQARLKSVADELGGPGATVRGAPWTFSTPTP
ncbi:hypothetical protein HBB16_20105 [Pseudonocardia sp. MCCB 268]|nr:hypothetical protein [Pseudonocardia cytotoxica]